MLPGLIFADLMARSQFWINSFKNYILSECNVAKGQS